VSIFGVLAKHRHFVAKTASYGAVLYSRGRGECGCRGVLTTRARNAFVTSYDRPKFVEQSFDFWAPYKIGRNLAEMRSYGAVLRRAEGGERDYRCILAKRARSVFASSL